MVEKEFEPDDPLMIAGVAFPGDTQAAMAETFVDEFMRMGFDDERILSVFRTPHYAGAYRVLVERGEPFIRQLIARARR